MAQGTIKIKKNVVVGSTSKKAALGPKKGARTVAPRKQVLVRSAKITKVCSFFFFLPFYGSSGFELRDRKSRGIYINVNTANRVG